MKDQVRLVAYYNWINRGRPSGDPMVDWSAAYDAVIHGDRSKLAPAPGGAEARRQLVVNFFRLAHVSRQKVVMETGIWESEDDAFDGQERWARVFKRAAEKGKLGALWAAVARQDESLAGKPNPFVV